MSEVIYLDKDTAASMTTFKELIKLYTKKNPKKFEEAIAKNHERYDALMKQVLATKEESSEELIAA